MMLWLLEYHTVVLQIAHPWCPLNGLLIRMRRFLDPDDLDLSDAWQHTILNTLLIENFL